MSTTTGHGSNVSTWKVAKTFALQIVAIIAITGLAILIASVIAFSVVWLLEKVSPLVITYGILGTIAALLLVLLYYICTGVRNLWRDTRAILEERNSN
jgi:uncharacterized membrane protein (DUF485 family)